MATDDLTYLMDSVDKLNEPFVPFPAIHINQIIGQHITDTIIDGFEIKALKYFYFTSTNKHRVLYTKAGNIILQNTVFLTSYLSNYIEELEEGEVITIHYGN